MQTSFSRTPALAASTVRCLPPSNLARPCVNPSFFLGRRNSLRDVRKLRQCRRATVSVQAAVDVWQTLAQLKVRALTQVLAYKTAYSV